MRRAQVFSNGVLAGMLTETDSGKYIFCYDDSFLIDEKQTAISLSFPKSQREFTSETLFPFFFNMLSEGTNKAIQCQTLKIDENDAFGLLLATAHTDTIGAIIVKKI
ncbi:MAG TPA: phosphatidylinositol kinase [Bacteroides graminisolvens]|jgi:HipA-like protein|uniref:Phosphatidylinositol kinase n=1 Tax=Bacteroides graminisolvens TaxID=477666 RepID=A0A3D2SFJ8_9BACE|nr:phosphatidylinositol kinase [Bacteroides graminisolvens]HPW71529.1 HipA N-terminal domain-containing protein [Bacteroides graminisolvens]